MTKKDLLKRAYPIIAKIASSRKSQKFAYYEGVDIEQEVWVFCLQAMDKYDHKKSSRGIPIDKKIEHFLNHHVTNRLFNLMRDRYFRPENRSVPGSKSGRSEVRMNLINALPIDICDVNNIDRVLGSGVDHNDPVSCLLAQETIETILSKLPEELVDPFKSLIGGNKIRKTIEMAIQEQVVQILQELEYDQ